MFSAVMRPCVKCLRVGRRRGLRLAWRAQELWRYGHLCLRSLLYNSFTNSDAVLDSLFEPVYWLVDHVTRWFGVVSALRGGGPRWGECPSTQGWGARRGDGVSSPPPQLSVPAPEPSAPQVGAGRGVLTGLDRFPACFAHS